MQKNILSIAAILGALSVILGAFGAHTLKAHLLPDQLSIYEKGVHYQMIHVLALIGVTMSFEKYRSRYLRYAGALFIVGIFFFSGSLYLLSTREITGISGIWLGPVTPLGGMALIVGWIFFFIGVKKRT